MKTNGYILALTLLSLMLAALCSLVAQQRLWQLYRTADWPEQQAKRFAHAWQQPTKVDTPIPLACPPQFASWTHGWQQCQWQATVATASTHGQLGWTVTLSEEVR